MENVGLAAFSGDPKGSVKNEVRSVELEKLRKRHNHRT